MRLLYLIALLHALLALTITTLAVRYAFAEASRAFLFQRSFEESRTMFEELQRTRGKVDAAFVCRSKY